MIQKNEPYVVDITKPPLPPPGREIDVLGETEQSILKNAAWHKYIKEYDDTLKASRRYEGKFIL